MKRYLLFGFDDHFPKGGMNDFIDDFDSLEEAHTEFINGGDLVTTGAYKNFQIYDTETKELALTNQTNQAASRSDTEEGG